MPHTPLALRGYQVAIMEQVNTELQTLDSLMVAAPTGSGKTVILAELVANCLRANSRVALLVHRQELLKQSIIHLTNQSGQTPGIVWKNRREWDRPATILAQDTLRNLEIPPEFLGIDTFIIDEAHHSAAPSWIRTIRLIQPKKLLGFSATPFRQDREPLCPEPFQKVIRPITPQELIDAGHLERCILESPIVHDANGQPVPINQAANIDQIYLQAVRYAISQGKSKILLYVSQTQDLSPTQVMDRTAQTLSRAGINNAAVHQQTGARRRSSAFSRFRTASNPFVLLNYIALTEGTDLPYVDCVIIGRSTASESTIIQMIGRGLRPHPMKDHCLVLEYTRRPDMEDIIHYWRIDEPMESGGNTQLERLPSQTQLQLAELATTFPQRINTLQDSRVEYPWFQPFPKKPIIALPLMPSPNREDRYITVEPRRNNLWTVSELVFRRSGPTPLQRRQRTAATPEEAVQMVRIALGAQAPQTRRTAPWRNQPATDPQQAQWRKLHPQELCDPAQLTAGEVSDAIAQARFRSRVNPSIL